MSGLLTVPTEVKIYLLHNDMCLCVFLFAFRLCVMEKHGVGGVIHSLCVWCNFVFLQMMYCGETLSGGRG